MADVTMPKLSDTMEEGKILRWLKQAGDRVEAGELLVEVETDKADMEVEAPSAGVLRELRLGEGDSAPVGAVIAVIDGGGAGESEAAPTEPPRDAKAASKARAGKATGEADQGAARRPGSESPRRAEPRAESATPRRDEQGADSQTRRDAEQGADSDQAPRGERKQAATPAAAPSKAAPRPSAAPAEGARRPAPARATHEVKASPLARALAEEVGIDLSAVRGTGPAGRVTRRDVEEAQAAAAGVKSRPARSGAAASSEVALDETPAPRTGEAGGEDEAAATEAARARRGPTARAGDAARADGATADEQTADDEATDDDAASRPDQHAERAKEPSPTAPGTRRVPLSRMRASIAKRMAESKREAPHFYLTSLVEMDEAVRLRAQLKTLEATPAGVTYNHMVIKAVADALREYPEVNARFAGDAIELVDEVNIGIATAVDDGLIVPVLRGADRLDLLAIAEQARALGEKAEAGRFTSADLSGATFSVSNLGMFDVDSFSAVINPPQAAILAVGSVKQRPVVRDGALAVGYTMALTLSCDHRVVDGARGGRFLAEVKRRLENPAALLLSGTRGR